MLLWGSAGCGKTTFANTAPGKRVYLNFDPDGLASLAPSDDTLVLDYSAEPDNCVSNVKSMNPFGLDTILKDNPDIKTVVVDSVTAFTTKAVAYSAGHTNAPGAVFENPGPAGYGFRNRHALGLVKSMLLVTGKYSRNVIFVCHEDVAEKDKEGNTTGISLLLGGSLKEEVPLQISEVWRISDNGSLRRAQIRTMGIYKPMKSRMFNTNSDYEFTISNKANPSKVQLSTLFSAWEEKKYAKLDVPK